MNVTVLLTGFLILFFKSAKNKAKHHLKAGVRKKRFARIQLEEKFGTVFRST